MEPGAIEEHLKQVEEAMEEVKHKEQHVKLISIYVTTAISN